MEVTVIVNGAEVGKDNIRVDADVSIRQEINNAIGRACEKYHAQPHTIGIRIGSEVHTY